MYEKKNNNEIFKTKNLNTTKNWKIKAKYNCAGMLIYERIQWRSIEG